tara:strand:- start:74 stop:685 length:612 start_codon:yes stop_codon:yes gene_type:complete
MITDIETPNMSCDQSIPFNYVQSNRNTQNLREIIEDKRVFSCVAIGSTEFFNEPGKSRFSIISKATSWEIYKYLDLYLEEAITQNYKHFIVLNESSKSNSKSNGGSQTTSNWVFLRSAEARYRKLITIQCLALASHSTNDMTAVWREEHGHISTKTFITGKSSKDRQIIIGSLAAKANIILVCEGSFTTLPELVTTYSKSLTL